MLLLKAGYSPLRFYVHDISKYFYLGELLALVDLSLVSFDALSRCLWKLRNALNHAHVSENLYQY